MKPIVLALLTPRGDELARLPIPRWQVAGPGEADARMKGGRLAPSVTQLEESIRSLLALEQVQVTLSEIDFQLAVSRGLLNDNGDPEVVIRLPIGETDNNRHSLEPVRSDPATLPLDAKSDEILSDLFELDLDDPEGEPHG